MGRKKIKMTKNNQNAQTETSVKKKIIRNLKVWSVMIPIGIIGWIGLGLISQNFYGYDSSQTAIETTLTAIQDNNTSKIARSFNTKDKSFEDKTTQLKAYAKAAKGKYTVKLSSEYTAYDEQDIDMDIVAKSIGFTPDDAKYTIANIESSQKNDDTNFDGISIYEIITYEYKDKWYIASLSEIGYEVLSMDYSPSTATMIGSDALGWIALTSDAWANAKTEQNMFTNVDAATYKYKGDDYTASITLSITDNTMLTDEAIDQIKSDFEKDGKYVGIHVVDDTINNETYKKIMAVHIEDDGSTSITYIWMYKNLLKDPYLHQIKLTTTNNADTYPIIMGYIQ